MGWSLNRVSFAHKILLALLVPSLGLLLFAVLVVQEKREHRQAADKAYTTMLHVSAVDAIIVSIQKERGFSAAFIASKQKLFSTELGSQNQHTEKSISNYIELLGDTPSSFLDALADREEIRRLVNSASEFDQAEVRYTQIIQAGLQHMHRLVVPLTFQAELSAYISLAWAREVAGKQRAALTLMLASNTFSLEDFFLVNKQTQRFKQKILEFTYTASSAQQELLEAVRHESVFTDVETHLKRMDNKLQLAEHANHVRLQTGFQGAINAFKN